MANQNVPERVYQRAIHWADRDEDTGCLVSRYSTSTHKYAQIGWSEGGERTVTLVHLVVWRYNNGPIPQGMTVDHHECRNRKCVEITHLRLLTNHENGRRTSGRDWPLGQCINGHPNSELRKIGKRWRCYPCHLAEQARYREKKRQQRKSLG